MGLMDFIMLYLNVQIENFACSIWNPSQLDTIRLSCLSLLSLLVTDSVKYFLSINGPIIIVDLLQHLINKAKTLDKDRIDLKRQSTALFESTLLLLSNLSERGPNLKKILGENGIFEKLLTIIGDDSHSLKNWSKALLICSSLCCGYRANKQLFGKAGGVLTILPLLTYESFDMQAKELVVISVVECIWGAIFGNREFEDLFIQNGGNLDFDYRCIFIAGFAGNRILQNEDTYSRLLL
jgi:hypothetical protein